MSLERAVQLVRDAGLSTGHADDCEGLVREMLMQMEEIRRERDDLRAEISQGADIVRAHNIESLSCDRDGEVYCDCLREWAARVARLRNVRS